ncbi:transporter substrate-binding domain-containing protein [Staphylococcus saccharolyticus]|uniref:transporter substrate-binding domain-containing protein n=1 Tax=Staphylococcus saccharolyticus TaxID=33028 RepID=UPI00102DFCC9|nr:transporter substrate-binding domain-containing protein [Staphylococcus saccharolyticus]MBL7573686.1 transporter substrate-binding domain-containing protein [Staphylococcus saccharolyticus]MBL7584524.1 transporter substrate-binding domain-containing protein [Staphylococcus saccharolyticus]MBL7639386.1 transporter substrate-binding domain-containing protein [Staphylococcus saccharolyticus]QRJ68704.1 transporter substrate-binding domain-containing protein [Staphylococcus saccharolyticus]TAA92
MKRLLLCVVALVFILAACGNNNSSSDKESKSDNKDRNTIRVGTEGTYAPFTFHNKKDQLTGYDIDVIKAVAKEENLKLKFNETSWDSMFAGLDTGRFDVIANQVGINKDRQKKYKFSDPYTYSSAVLVVRENEKNIKSFNDVKDKKLAQTFTSNYGQLAKDNSANITKVDGFNQSMDLLLSKRVDGTFNDSLSYLDYKKQKPNAKIKAIKDHAEQSKSAFAFSKKVDDKSVEKFNKGLKKIRDNGELAKIGKKWFGQDVSKSE